MRGSWFERRGQFFRQFEFAQDAFPACHRHLACGLGDDALHLFRTGGTLDALRAVDPAVIGYAQICDGPDLRVTGDYLDEAMHRMVPGTGVFPLQKFVGILGAQVDLDIEVPGFGSQGNPGERAMRAVIASQKLLEERETEIDQ